MRIIFTKRKSASSSCFLIIYLNSVLILIDSVNSFLSFLSPKEKLSGSPFPVGSVWPRPYQHISDGTKYFAIDTQTFMIQLWNSKSKKKNICPLLDWAIKHYQRLVRNLNPNTTNKNKYHDLRKPAGRKYSRRKLKYRNQTMKRPSLLLIKLNNCGYYRENYKTTFETYKLNSKKHGPSNGKGIIALMHAASVQAAIRGLETFYQMLWPKLSADGINLDYNINATYIKDLPRFAHRGLLLDTSRHFLTENIIIKILTGMMYNKLNVFHWHIIDDQSFPFQSRVFPELSQKGAYHMNAVYTPETVQRIIAAARVRGIRTIMEFDTPGHTAAIGKSHPELLTPCFTNEEYSENEKSYRHALYENLDPSNEKVYDFTRKLFTEIVKNVTKEEYVHLGMDEVNTACWNDSNKIKMFMDANNFTETYQVLEHYTQRHIAMVRSLGGKMIAWQDPIDDGVNVDKDVVIQVWKKWGPWQRDYLDILKKGYKVIFSYGWYLSDTKFREDYWTESYESDPYLYGRVPPKYRRQILGGEAAVWGEFLDSTNIEPIIFPNVGVIGSILWDSHINFMVLKMDVADTAKFNLDTFRCSLVRRGIAAQPIYPGSCFPYEYQADGDADDEFE